MDSKPASSMFWKSALQKVQPGSMTSTAMGFAASSVR